MECLGVGRLLAVEMAFLQFGGCLEESKCSGRICIKRDTKQWSDARSEHLGM